MNSELCYNEEVRAATQCDWVLGYMRLFGSLTALDAEEQHGIRRLAARIKDLRRQGYDIHSEIVAVRNRRGEPCRVARYSLAEEVKVEVGQLVQGEMKI